MGIYPAVMFIEKAKKALDNSHMRADDQPPQRKLAEAQLLATLAVADAARKRHWWPFRRTSTHFLAAWNEFDRAETATDNENALLMLAEAQVFATLAVAEGISREKPS
jgi:hypothetical protein